jgi:hypothetical protein
LQTVELCGWLESEELVINGQLSPKAAGLDLMGLVPPNLQTIVQAEVDQLALVPRVVLHCAAVLGVQFEALALFDMMPSDIVHNPAELQEQLEVLHDAHLIQRPAWISENVALSGANYQDYWKVRTLANLTKNRLSQLYQPSITHEGDTLHVVMSASFHRISAVSLPKHCGFG